MKSCRRRNPAVAAIGAWCFSKLVARAKALHYGCAAMRDERNGFSYAAAMEWRKAAELFGSDASAAEYCWRQWERIMRLPRRLAAPVGVCQQAVSPLPVAPRPAIAPAIGQISFADAA